MDAEGWFKLLVLVATIVGVIVKAVIDRQAAKPPDPTKPPPLPAEVLDPADEREVQARRLQQKLEAARQRAETAKVEAARVEAARAEETRAEVRKAEAVRAEKLVSGTRKPAKVPCYEPARPVAVKPLAITRQQATSEIVTAKIVPSPVAPTASTPAVPAARIAINLLRHRPSLATAFVLREILDAPLSRRRR